MTISAYIAALAALEAKHGPGVEVVCRAMGAGILPARRPVARHRLRIGVVDHAHFFHDESESTPARDCDRLVVEVG